MLLRLSLLLSLALLACCEPERRQVRSFSGPTMGSTYEVKFVGTRRQVGGVHEVVEQELAAFDAAFSNWRDDSEIARVNGHASTEPIEVSDRFAGVLQLALRLAAATDGAFDPTLKPLSDAYRAAKEDPSHGLADDTVAGARERVGYRMISLEGRRLRKARSDVQLDLDGLVAGAAADAIAARLRDRGVASFYLQITGEVYCAGSKPDGQPWRIGVVDPSSSAGDQAAVVALPLRDAALCSSGDYRNATIVDGKVVHHVFDPRTGKNPEHRVVSASVLASSCAVADALGTAIMVLGADATRIAWPRMQGLGAVGALLLLPGDNDTWNKVEIEWPSEGS